MERYGNPFYFLTEFPSVVKVHVYAHRFDERPQFVDYFDLDYRGLELASGGLWGTPDGAAHGQYPGPARVDPASLEGYLERSGTGCRPTEGGASAWTASSQFWRSSRTSESHGYFLETAIALPPEPKESLNHGHVTSRAHLLGRALRPLGLRIQEAVSGTGVMELASGSPRTGPWKFRSPPSKAPTRRSRTSSSFVPRRFSTPVRGRCGSFFR